MMFLVMSFCDDGGTERLLISLRVLLLSKTSICWCTRAFSPNGDLNNDFLADR